MHCTQFDKVAADVINWMALFSLRTQQLKQAIGPIVGQSLDVQEVSEQVVDIDAECLFDPLHLDARTRRNEEALHFIDHIVKTMLPHTCIAMVFALDTPTGLGQAQHLGNTSVMPKMVTLRKLIFGPALEVILFGQFLQNGFFLCSTHIDTSNGSGPIQTGSCIRLQGHSQVQALGETTGLQRAVDLASKTPRADPLSPAVMTAAAKGDPEAMAQAYLHYTAYLRDESPVFTEKLPHNYLYVGHFNRAFPSAPMVHVRRSPMDSLFGTYRLLFGGGAYPWSYSLKDLADNYRLYRQLTDHWRQIMGQRLIEITLEALIDDPEPQIRALLSGCGLPFEPACLSPERSERGVSTASSAQVRSPINRQGMGAWKRYREQLEPLRAALEADGFVDGEGEAV